MGLLTRLKFFIIGIFLGSLLVFFFFGQKVGDWFFNYSSKGRIINCIMEPKYNIIHYGDTIGDHLSLQGVFSILESKQKDFNIEISFEKINQIEDPITYIQQNSSQVQDGFLSINKKNIYYTDDVLKKLGLEDLPKLDSEKIIDSLIMGSTVQISERGGKKGKCFKYLLENEYKKRPISFLFKRCNSIIELISFKKK